MAYTQCGLMVQSGKTTGCRLEWAVMAVWMHFGLTRYTTTKRGKAKREWERERELEAWHAMATHCANELLTKIIIESRLANEFNAPRMKRHSLTEREGEKNRERERQEREEANSDEPLMKRRNWKAQKQRTEQRTEIKGSQLKARIDG